MARVNASILTLNGGEVSQNALARVDLAKMRLCAETQVNLIPRTIGAAMMRPGLGYLASTRNDDPAKFFEFVFAADDAAAFEFVDGYLRVWRGDPLTPISRTSVSTAITSGTFASSSGWTTETAGGGAVTFAANALVLSAPGRGGYSRIRQSVTVAGGDVNKAHGLRIRINNGKVLFRVGSTAGGQEYIRETELENGHHSIEFTPTASFFIQFENREQRDMSVYSVAIESAGVMELPTIYVESDLPYIRKYQTGDIVYLACDGRRPQAIERRGPTSFSIVDFRPEDGPFSKARTARARLKPSVSEGNGTLTADFPFFSPSHVGAIFELFHEGYDMTFRLGASKTPTEPIRVTGIWDSSANEYNDRDWTYNITGTWAGTLRIGRAIDDADSGYKDFPIDGRDGGGTSITANRSKTLFDRDNNTIYYYRIGFKDGEYTSGVASVRMRYDGGGGYGRCRVTGYTSPTQVSIEVLRPFTNVTWTEDWKEGLWSGLQGWPSAVGFTEGRLIWGKGDAVACSVSDQYESYDVQVEGDSASIQRTVSSGAIDRINWILSLQRLLVGTQGAETTIRSSSLDEPLTPTAFTPRDASTQGSSPLVPAVKVDSFGLFIQKSNARLYRLAYAPEAADYASQDLTKINDTILAAGVKAMAIQRQPNTRAHLVLSNGAVAMFVTDLAEDVDCWVGVSTDGEIEDVFVLPGAVEDKVFYVVRRTINGQERRFVEQWALESEAVNGALNKIADSFVVYTGTATTSIPAAHLEGESVVVWANGAAIADGTSAKPYLTVSGGVVTLAAAATNVVVGLPYQARYKSVKLAYGAQFGTALLQRKAIKTIGFMLADAHLDAVKYGPDFDTLDPMPIVEADAVQAEGTVYSVYDADPRLWPGGWDTDSRICLEIDAPYGGKILGIVAGIDTAERT